MDNKARAYKVFTNIETIFDNDILSVYTEITQYEPYTIVYDLATESNLYIIPGHATNAGIIGDKLIIFNNSSDIIKILDIKNNAE